MVKAKLARGPTSQNRAGLLKKRRWPDKFMYALVLVIIVAYAVLATTLVYIAITENGDSLAADDDSFRLRLIFWCAVGGIVALAFGIACLRFGLFRTLSLVIASGFFVFVIGYRFLVELKMGGDGNSLVPLPIAPWHPLVLLLVAGAVAWCLWNPTQNLSPNGRSRRTFGVTAFVSAGMILFAAWVWAFGLGSSKSQNHSEVQATASAKPQPTSEDVMRIIATDLKVPWERAVPSARLVEDLNASNADIERMVEDFETTFGIDREPPDDEMLITVQDAIDYVNAPEAFRTEHEDHFRGQR
jgi:acyl carrier protein